MSPTARFQETLLRLAMIGEGFVKDEAGLALGSAATSALDPKTATLLQVGASVTIGPSPVCLQWSITRAMAAGATEDEIADVLLAIAPVTGLGRIAAAPDVAIALGYDVTAALEELDEIVLQKVQGSKMTDLLVQPAAVHAFTQVSDACWSPEHSGVQARYVFHGVPRGPGQGA